MHEPDAARVGGSRWDGCDAGILTEISDEMPPTGKAAYRLHYIERLRSFSRC